MSQLLLQLALEFVEADLLEVLELHLGEVLEVGARQTELGRVESGLDAGGGQGAHVLGYAVGGGLALGDAEGGGYEVVVVVVVGGGGCGGGCGGRVEGRGGLTVVGEEGPAVEEFVVGPGLLVGGRVAALGALFDEAATAGGGAAAAAVAAAAAAVGRGEFDLVQVGGVGWGWLVAGGRVGGGWGGRVGDGGGWCGLVLVLGQLVQGFAALKERE